MWRWNIKNFIKSKKITWQDCDNVYNINVKLILQKEEAISVSTVKVGENESLDSALKRFKRKCQRDSILGEIRRREFYEKPSVRRKKKAEAAKKRSSKNN